MAMPRSAGLGGPQAEQAPIDFEAHVSMLEAPSAAECDMGNRVWLVLVGLAIALTVACSSTSSGTDAGDQDAPTPATGG